MNLINTIDATKECFSRQQKAFAKIPYTSLKYRKKQLKALKKVIIADKDVIANAISDDFGCRNNIETIMVDILTSVGQINYSLKHLKSWMAPKRRDAGIMFYPAKAEIHMQPKGVIGIITPWNYPVFLALGPLISALAAGNRAMIKMSEFTPHTNKALTETLAKCFTQDEVAIVEGELDISQTFSNLPFDHILFTGSTNVGKSVMASAASSLVPVTLELGGKSPCILMNDFSVKRFARDFLLAKTLNSGQTCVAPDTLYCHREQFDDLIETVREQYLKHFPASSQQQDITSMIHQPHFERMQAIVSDAEQKGANIIPLIAEEALQGRQMPLTFVTECSADMTIMQEEIFGPLLPVVLFEDVKEVIKTINEQPRPLALYLFSNSLELQREILYTTHSGGVCLNDAGFHVGVEDLPFGGIGPSGMGSYHGDEGFKTFSHAKSVLSRGKINLTPLFGPPYGRKLHDLLLRFMLR